MKRRYSNEQLYHDIIQRSHHVSDTHPPMPMSDRAAQFMPFMALTGYGSAVDETARVTDERIELDESQKTLLDVKLQMLYEHMKEQPEVTITYFRPDLKKAGGAYVTVSGSLKKIDSYRHTVIFQNGPEIAFEDIYAISGGLFDALEAFGSDMY